MPKPLRTPCAVARLLGPSLLLAVFLLGSPDNLLAQVHTTGIPTTKTCPATAAPGSQITCTYLVTNVDTQHGVINLAVTNQVPFPGGPIVPIDCLQAGSPVTTLGAAGSGTESCGGDVLETAPPCDPAGNVFFTDRVSATGEDAGVTGLPVDGAASGSVLILACTPTPTNTPINTPTNTPPNTPTNTPPSAPPPTVPTLSFPMMALLGLMLAGAGLFLSRRS